jgi:gamma-glutamylcyclotransferase (GGCT)/AIG2-like uncharacterized protein YtfP
MDYPYFAYGSNMNIEQMSQRCPGAILGDLCYLTGWRYFINGNGYAGIEEDKGGIVWGCLWILNQQHWLALDEYEGVSGGYYTKKNLEVIIEKNKENMKVTLYLSNDYNYGTPGNSYQEIVIQGSRDNSLPEPYIASIESWFNGPPAAFHL